jgi:hypothetical protein
LEAIDVRLEEICADEEEKWNNDGILEDGLEDGLEEELGDDDGLLELGDDIIREDFYNDSIRVEDFGLHYYHYQSLIRTGMKNQGATN